MKRNEPKQFKVYRTKLIMSISESKINTASDDHGAIVGKKYRIIKQLSAGSFGFVYQAEHIRSKLLVAIKVEPFVQPESFNLIKHETHIYQYIGIQPGFLTVKWYGTDNYNTYMVTQLLAKSLVQPQNIALSWLAIQMCNRLKTLHGFGLIHRDIKPDNFMLNFAGDMLYLIDMGFCTKRTVRNEIPTNAQNIIGTLNYVSVAVHFGHEPSYRDDLESCAYVLAYVAFGYKLPWFNMVGADLVKCKREFVNKYKLPRQICMMIDYARAMQFNDQIDFNTIIGWWQQTE